MLEVKNTIAVQPIKGLRIQQLTKTEMFEILSISLEKDAIFPEHISPTDAQLVVLEGDIIFHIKGEPFHLKQQQHFSFPKNEKHWVKANSNSNFLIIR